MISQRLPILTVLALALCSCGQSAEQRDDSEQSSINGDAQPSIADSIRTNVDTGREFDEDRATEVAEETLDTESYADENGPGDCSTNTCHGHEAGWKWAQDHGDDCGSDESESFNEGCAAYSAAVDQLIENARNAFNNGDRTFEKN